MKDDSNVIELKLKKDDFELLKSFLDKKVNELSEEVWSALNNKDYNGFPDNTLLKTIDLYNSLNWIYQEYFD